MANTKKSLRILNGTALDTAVDVQGNVSVITAADMGTTIVSNALVGAATDAYDAAVAGTFTIDMAAPVTASTELTLTLIDVTDGREKFPRRTYTAATTTALIALINNSEVRTGDGFTVTAVATSGEAFTLTMPANRILRVAAVDGATITAGTAPELQKGYTAAQAKAYALDMIADQYGRTNRVGFPIVEPDLDMFSATNYDLVVVTKVGAVQFDKNTANSYQDVEEFHFLIDASQTTLTDS